MISETIIKGTPINKNTDFVNPIRQGKLNPNLNNVIKKSLIIDSTFRQYSFNTNNITHITRTNPFTIDLNHPINDLLSMKLYSLHIPLNWYNISSNKKNNTFFLSFDDTMSHTDNPMSFLTRNVYGNLELNIDAELICNNNYIPIVMKDNLYENIHDLITEINKTIVETKEFLNEKLTSLCGLNKNITLLDVHFKYNDELNLVEMVVKKGSVRFFSHRNNSYIDYSLGWILGFRRTFYDMTNINENLALAEVKYNLTDTKFIMIYIDDYLHNRQTTNTESASDYTISSHSTSIQNTLVPTTIDTVNTEEIQQLLMENVDDIKDKNSNIVPIPLKPRQSSSSLLYAKNEDLNIGSTPTSVFKANRLPSPVTSNAFAIIPIKGTSVNNNNKFPYIDFSGSLQVHERKYFGPVNLRRMKVTLVDDKGQIIDLRGSEWSFVVTCELLYQY